MKNLFSTLLLIAAFFQAGNLAVYSQTATAPSAGDGTSGNPYQIATLDNLYWVSTNVASSLGKYYLQTTDIDASSTSTWFSNTGWVPIGSNSSSAFLGNYNGGGKTISGLTINSTNTVYNAGLFGYIQDATITSLTLSNVAISNQYNSASYCHAGALFAYSTTSTGKYCTIENCSSSGTVTCSNTTTGTKAVSGGLAGYAYSAKMSNSSSSCTVTSNATAGGLIGNVGSLTIVSLCYATGNVSINSTFTNTYAGGFAGTNSSTNTTISNCYATGSVTNAQTTASSAWAASFCGSAMSTTMTNCYGKGAVTSIGTAYAKGFIGRNMNNFTAVNVISCYFDKQTTGQLLDGASAGTTATGKTTLEMNTQSTYTGWDFTGETTNGSNDYWSIYIGTNGGYPYLKNFFPSVTSSEITEFTGNTATMGGEVTSAAGGAITGRGVVYSTTDNTPTIGESGVTQDANGTGTGVFSELITGLASLSTYYVQAYVTNSSGTVYGGVKSFTTPSSSVNRTSIADANWEEASTWSPSGLPTSDDNVTINSMVSVSSSLAVSPAVCNNLTINSGILSIAAGKALTVSGTLTNSAGNAGLVINSGGSLIQNSTDVAATVKRAITGDDKFHLFISPINEAVVADAASCFNGAYVDRYQESDGEWVRLTTDDNVVSDYGYSVNFANGTPELTFPGTLKASPASYTNLSNTPAAPGYGPGWNLAGNPYPCGINTALLTAPTGMNATAYVWDETGSGNYIPLTMGAASITPGIIAPMQGFFVNTSSATNSLTLANAAKVHGGTFYKSGNYIPQMLSLSITGNGYSDKTHVRFDEAATENFDQALDAYKLSGLDKAPQLYSILPGEKAAINTLPSYTANQFVPLGLRVGIETNYTLTVEGISSFDPSVPISLDDLKLGTSQDLRFNPVYSFTASPIDDENRFKLSFATVTGINEKDALGITVHAVKGIIHVSCEGTDSGKVFVYSTTGQLLATSILTSGETSLRMASTGVYLVKVVTGKTSLTRKLVVLQ
jgi:hypothetical protein